MGNGKSIADQIQDALRGLEDSGLVTGLGDQSEVDDEKAEDEAAPTTNKPDVPHDDDTSPS